MKRLIQKLMKSGDVHASERTTIVVLSLLVFLIGFSGTSLFAQEIAQQRRTDFEASVAQQALTTKQYLEDRMDRFGILLNAAVATYRINDGFTRGEWRRFYESMDIQDEFSSLTGVGYVTRVKPENVASFEQEMRDQGLADFTITPTDPRDEYTAITYLEPLDAANRRAIGYDMFSEPSRRHAMANARDSARVTMSAPVQLVQDGDEELRYGQLLYYPVYTKGVVPATIAERREQLVGYVYLVFRSDVALEKLASSSSFQNDIDIVVRDESIDGPITLFSTRPSAPDTQPFNSHITEQVHLDNRQWTVTASGRDALFNQFIGPIGVFTMGIIVSGVASVLIYSILNSRISRVSQTYQEEVRRTKDELLALASHQLRTPATGVKQYIGMLTAGVTGPLTSEQQIVATKAYEANERQLEIINELLYVSKIDAGQLLIEPRSINLTKIVQDVIDNFSEQAALKEIVLSFRKTDPLRVHADDRFIKMAIENMVSNAIKYSYPSSKVTIRVMKDGQFAKIAVKDKGVGLSEGDFEQIFEKFGRIENPLSHSEGGSGLGLFLARQLARAHGGDIEVTSAIGEGSEFTLVLPNTANLMRRTVDIKGTNKKIRKERYE